jgi:hypothetical protein
MLVAGVVILVAGVVILVVVVALAVVQVCQHISRYIATYHASTQTLKGETLEVS